MDRNLEIVANYGNEKHMSAPELVNLFMSEDKNRFHMLFHTRKKQTLLCCKFNVFGVVGCKDQTWTFRKIVPPHGKV